MELSKFALGAAVGAAMVAVTAMGATSAGAATLLGDSVDASSASPFVESVSPGTATVGAGDEFTVDFGNFFFLTRLILVDLDATTISLRYSGGAITSLEGLGVTLNLTNLSFGAGIGGVSVVQTPPDPATSIFGSAFGGNVVTFTDTSVSVLFGGAWDGNASMLISLSEKVTTEPPPVVPLPASAVLLLAGLGGLAALRRRTG